MYKPKHESVAAWAKTVGSSAKTLAGQRKAIIASFRPIVGNDAHKVYRKISRAEYYADCRRRRQYKFAESHHLVLSSPPPATMEQVYAGSSEVSLHDMIESERSNFLHCVIAGYVVRTSEKTEWDYGCYSKSWHRQYGGKKVVSSRTVHIRRVLDDGTLDVRDVSVDAWRGNYLLNAIVAAGIVSNNKSNMAVRLHPAFELETVRTGKLTIYRRTLGGVTYDYCAVWCGVTYHAETIKLAINGLRTKMRSISESKSHIVDWKFGKSLGFCENGMRQFARDFDLDVSAKYTPDEIEQRVKSNPEAAGQYRVELCKLAETFALLRS